MEPSLALDWSSFLCHLRWFSLEPWQASSSVEPYRVGRREILGTAVEKVGSPVELLLDEVKNLDRDDCNRHDANARIRRLWHHQREPKQEQGETTIMATPLW